MDCARAHSQSGFTLVEVMVSITVLLVGVLGTVTLVDSASQQTSRTKAREGATALARTVLEVARGVPYADLTSERLLDELDARAGLADSDTAPGHQVASRGFEYTVLPTVCSMDDPKDALGAHDEVGVSFCADSDEATGGSGPVDRNPDDYRRIAVNLTWRSGSAPTDSVTQTGIVTNPVGGLGPSIVSLTPDSPTTTTIDGGFDTATYDVTTSVAADDVAWLVNGSRLGSALTEDAGVGLKWGLEWDLGPVDEPLVLDCTYLVQAQALDEKGRGGAPRALTVVVDRRVPFAPRNFEGGPNLRVDDDVDLQWDANRECDVEGYRVYRGVDGGPVDQLVCETGPGDKTECVDQEPPTGALTYEVVAFDANGEGDRSTPVAVPWPIVNQRPDPPETLSVCTGGAFEPPCLDIEGNAAPDGTAVLSWPPASDPDGDGIRFYRVYRDGTAYANRLDVLFPVFDELGEPVTPLVFVDATPEAQHDYWVTAVDNRYGESDPRGPVTWAP